MKYGTVISIQRGSDHHAKNLRRVDAIYIGSQGMQIRYRLVRDDVGAIVEPKKKNETGWTTKSAIIRIISEGG